MKQLNSKVISSLRSAALVGFITAVSPEAANAQLFKGIPVLEDVERGATDIAEGAVYVVEGAIDIVEGAGEIIEEIAKDAEKLVSDGVEEIANVGEGLIKLVETGNCGGDICDALKAVATFVESTIEDTGDSVENAVKRLGEGKPVDALWHLATDPINDAQENAAEAAIESSVLRAVGQVAATAYGGPKGAAAYSAWLTYNATDGDLEASLKAGTIAGVTSYAMGKITKDVEFFDVVEGVTADEIVQRALLSGAVSGIAVGLSGGDQDDVEKAFISGAITSVIRDGYKELTKSHLDDNMKGSTGEGYCLGADPNTINVTTEARLTCLPDPDAYITKDGSPVKYNQDGTIDVDSIAKDIDGKPKIDFFKLDYDRPHVGTFAASEDGSIISERSLFMTGISRLPGMNGMSVAHDIFDMQTNPETGIYVVDMAYRVGTIAPFVIATYEGAGNTVQDMIRDVAIEAEKQKNTPQTEGPDSASNSAELNPLAQLDTIAGSAEVNPVEIRHLYATRADGRVRNILMESKVEKVDQNNHRERICSVDQYVNGDRWMNLFNAHYQRSYCIEKFNELAIRSLNEGYTVHTSIGMRFDPVNDDVEITHTHFGRTHTTKP
ncbi:MAG: hypothetical protein AAF292_14230 [Pseudomonadota bacterium]